MKPRIIRAVLFSANKFDKVHKVDKGKVKQAMSDLGTCKKDMVYVHRHLCKFNAGNTGEKNELLLDEPTYKDCQTQRRYIAKLYQDNPDEAILVLYAFSGHGLNKNGLQCMIINEF